MTLDVELIMIFLAKIKLLRKYWVMVFETRLIRFVCRKHIRNCSGGKQTENKMSRTELIWEPKRGCHGAFSLNGCLFFRLSLEAPSCNPSKVSHQQSASLRTRAEFCQSNASFAEVKFQRDLTKGLAYCPQRQRVNFSILKEETICTGTHNYYKSTLLSHNAFDLISALSQSSSPFQDVTFPTH